MKYQRTQVGWWMIALMTLIIVNVTLDYFLKFGNRPLPLSAYLILLFVFISVFLIFYKLKIVVDQSTIHIVYGVGFVHIKIKPETIHSVKVVKVPWMYGWGIRFTNKGMLYNIQGRRAVELYYRTNGKEKRVWIGSDDPASLKDFIEKAYLAESKF